MTATSHNKEDVNSDRSQKNALVKKKLFGQNFDTLFGEFDNKPYLAMRMMIRIGSLAMVKRNMASGGPNARNAQPKNSRRAIFLYKSV